MRVVFSQEDYTKAGLTPAVISEEVEMVGFSAELLEMIENNQEDLLRSEVLNS
jgi:hypothetical protein